MKTAKLGDYLLWRGKLAKVMWQTKEPTIGIVFIEPNKCPHCGGLLEPESFDTVVDCPNFQENAEPLNTIKDDDA